jgi:excinuclease ABC subunit C
MRFLQSILPLRTCRDREMKMRRRPCIEYEMGRCSAPCVGLIAPEEYDRLVKDGMAFLEGRTKSLLSEMRVRMNKLADDLDFEGAAVLRDRIAALENALEKQQIVSMAAKNRDVFGFCREGDMTQINLLYIRDGRMTGQKTFLPIRLKSETAELVSSLLMRYYDEGADVPNEVVVPMELEDAAVISEWLSDKKGKMVHLVVPRRGEALSLLKIAFRNAENALKTSRLADRSPEEALRVLQEKCSLRRIPRSMECFDISNIGGKYAVGSLVAFTEGIPDKNRYRRFRIRTVPGADDFAMMYEVLRRRYEKKEGIPDLIVVDGGKGQLGVAVAVMKDIGIEGVDLIGLAKERDEKEPETVAFCETSDGPAGDLPIDVVMPGTKGKTGRRPVPVGRLYEDKPKKSEDRVFIPGRKDPIYLSRWPSAFFLLQRIRDEAHRFAISYHRKLRQKSDLRSVLDEIPGIGPTRKKALLVHFGDLRTIRQASVDELMKVEGIGGDTARAIRRLMDNYSF